MSLPFFTELTPGGFLVREDVRFVGVQLCLLRTEDLRVTGGGGLFTGELLLGIFDLEMIVLGGTL